MLRLFALALALPLLCPVASAQIFGQVHLITDDFTFANTLTVGDLDGDGDSDLVVTGGQPFTLRNLGGGAFGPKQDFPYSTQNLGDVQLVDLDGDGDLDMLGNWFGPFGNFAWHENGGNGRFLSEHILETVGNSPSRVTFGDLDGDGDLDLAGTFSGTSEVYWYENQGTGQFSAKQLVGNTALFPSAIHVGDLDGDGDDDVLCAAIFPSRILWYESLGGGQFGPERQVGQYSHMANPFLVADLDGDGDADVAVGNKATPSISWFENLGAGTFGPDQLLVGSAFAQPAGLADMNLDGNIDLWARGSTLGKYFENKGGVANYMGGEYWAVGAGGAYGFQIVDVDGDGALDGLYGDSNAGIHWAENITIADCNGTGAVDLADIAAGTSLDCNGNNIPDECDIASGVSQDVDGNGIPDSCLEPAMWADSYEASLQSGAWIKFHLKAPSALDPFLVLGSLSGTSPGTMLDSMLVPLNLDGYFTHTLTHSAQRFFTSSQGVLFPSSSGGEIHPTLHVPAILGASFVGLTVHHAFITFDAASGKVSFVSNAVPTLLTR
jgi:hypothetical protein